MTADKPANKSDLEALKRLQSQADADESARQWRRRRQGMTSHGPASPVRKIDPKDYKPSE
jgi:hypothetical protein